jgi:hypothetical protein
MPYTFGARFKHAWNAFLNRDPTRPYDYGTASSYGTRPDRVRLNLGTERSIVSAVYNRIAMDVAQTTIRHVILDDDDRYKEVVKGSGLDYCLNVEANIDQTAKAFMQDLVLSMFDEGCVAVVPVDTDIDPAKSESFEVNSLRVAKITSWHPNYVDLRLYNDRTGLKEDIALPKSTVAIIENPFYSVMNEPNSTLRRLVYKLNLLDAVDEQSSSGKLDLVIQLPYVVKGQSRKAQAEQKRLEMEAQLSGSKYGVAYIDSTEKITQLNRPVDNNLMTQIEYLTAMLYSQLGSTENVFNGTAKEDELTNYYGRTVEPIVSVIVDEFLRKFLSKKARSEKQSLYFFRDPFRFTPVSKIADMADALGRNEIVTPNEFRQSIGLKVSKDKSADDLRNRNLSPSKEVEQELLDKKTKTVTKDQNGG